MFGGEIMVKEYFPLLKRAMEGLKDKGIDNNHEFKDPYHDSTTTENLAIETPETVFEKFEDEYGKRP